MAALFGNTWVTWVSGHTENIIYLRSRTLRTSRPPLCGVTALVFGHVGSFHIVCVVKAYIKLDCEVYATPRAEALGESGLSEDGGEISNSTDSRGINSTRNLDDVAFDRADVRTIFILLYSIVFFCCFFGNLLVIIVVTMSRHLRSITNFFLLNLAVADFCVGTFCVYQNLSIYLISSWVLGDMVCKLYHFVHYLSHTASVLILVVVCVERYLAILHPITCKQILTPTRLRIVVGLVWLCSALYSSPRLLWVQTITITWGRGETEIICIAHREKYNSETFDLVNFALLYVAPLAVMLSLYTRIAFRLWDSSRGLDDHSEKPRLPGPDPLPPGHIRCPPVIRHVDHSPGSVPFGPPGAAVNTIPAPAATNVPAGAVAAPTPAPGAGLRRVAPPCAPCYTVSASVTVLRARRGVIRMLIVVVLVFAVCNLPYHARKMWQYWSPQYCGSSTFSSLFTPATFLLTYVNSGVNPLLYAFLSRNFRKGMRELPMYFCPSCLCPVEEPLTRGPQTSFRGRTPVPRAGSTSCRLSTQFDTTYSSYS